MADPRYIRCLNCKAEFSKANTHSHAGWLETQISGLCEDCFDEICAEVDEPIEDFDDDIPAF